MAVAKANAAGQIIAIEQGAAQGQYRYDALGQLTQALDAQDQTHHAFTYSQTGDRLSKRKLPRQADTSKVEPLAAC